MKQKTKNTELHQSEASIGFQSNNEIICKMRDQGVQPFFTSAWEYINPCPGTEELDGATIKNVQHIPPTNSQP